MRIKTFKGSKATKVVGYPGGLPRFKTGVASLFDFSGSIASDLVSPIRGATIKRSLQQDGCRVARDMRRVYDSEIKKFDN